VVALPKISYVPCSPLAMMNGEVLVAAAAAVVVL
jgi:hypothetical protein